MSEPIPIACTLTPKGAADQLDEWATLRAAATDVAPIDDGVTMRFPAELAGTVDDLAAREATCCAFLSLTTRAEGDQIVLDITSADPAAQPVIAIIAGTS